MRPSVDVQGQTTLPEWLPTEMHHYLAHTGAGLSIRDIARRVDCHASTISRRIARIEQQRDDPLIDLTLSQIEAKLKSVTPDAVDWMKREIVTMTKENAPESEGALNNLDKEAARILRRLCETGAVLAIAEDMDVAVVVREGPDGTTTRTAVVAQETAQAMAVNGWIETGKTGRIMRYKITNAGRDRVKHLLANSEAEPDEAPRYAMAEAPAKFTPAPNDLADAANEAEQERRKLRYNLAESPLTVLARRRDKHGEAFLSDDLVRCGERLREDFELAQMGPSMSQNWAAFLTAGVTSSTTSGDRVVGYGPEAAKARVVAALTDLGPGLSDVALRCCCYLEGLESTEKRMGWSARSGKVVLRIALQRLQRHYEETLTPEAQMIG